MSAASAHHYIVTAHKPTAVNACVTGRDLFLSFLILSIGLWISNDMIWVCEYRKFYITQRHKLDNRKEHEIGTISGDS